MNIELGAGVHVQPGDLDSLLKLSGMSWLVHNYFPPPENPFVLNLASQNPGLLAQSRALCEKAIEWCARLRAPFYSVHAGFRADVDPASLGRPLQHGQVQDYATAFATFAEAVRSLAEFGAARGVGILVEPNVVPAFNLTQGHNEIALLAEPREIEPLMRAIGHPGAGLLLDTGHLNVTAQTLGFSRTSFLDAAMPYVKVLHVHDNDATFDLHEPVGSTSWVLALLHSPEVAECPLVVESRFPDVSQLRRYCDWLCEQLA